MKPSQPRYPVEIPDYYEAQDFYIGATVNINSVEYVIMDADEYTLKYMVKNRLGPFANVDEIINRKFQSLDSKK